MLLDITYELSASTVKAAPTRPLFLSFFSVTAYSASAKAVSEYSPGGVPGTNASAGPVEWDSPAARAGTSTMARISSWGEAIWLPDSPTITRHASAGAPPWFVTVALTVRESPISPEAVLEVTALTTRSGPEVGSLSIARTRSTRGVPTPVAGSTTWLPVRSSRLRMFSGDVPRPIRSNRTAAAPATWGEANEVPCWYA